MSQPLSTILQEDNAQIGRIQEALKHGETGVRQLLASQKQELIKMVEETFNDFYLVEQNPSVVSGQPVIRGTRVKIESFIGHLRAKLQQLKEST